MYLARRRRCKQNPIPLPFVEHKPMTRVGKVTGNGEPLAMLVKLVNKKINCINAGTEKVWPETRPTSQHVSRTTETPNGTESCPRSVRQKQKVEKADVWSRDIMIFAAIDYN